MFYSLNGEYSIWHWKMVKEALDVLGVKRLSTIERTKASKHA